MTKGGGKGRISNTLVAASCAAVLTVYAAGYWRTRDAAGRMDARAQERRPVRSAPKGAPVPAAAPDTDAAAVIDPAASPAPPSTAAPPSTQAPPSAPAQHAPAPAPLAAQRETSEPAPPAPPEPSAPAPALASPALTAPALAATAEPESAPDPLAAPSGHWRDGTYTGWGTSRHGDIKAQVVIRNGRIVDAGIASCETRYPCDVISNIIAQPVARQSPDVDTVSRATESADAYYYGLVEALKEAQVPPDGETAGHP